MSRPRMHPGSHLARPRAAGDDAAVVVVHYQPILDLLDGGIVGVEALARVQHTDRLAPPAEFIGPAERDGTIHALGASVLTQACTQAVSWAGRAPISPQLLVNLSAVQLGEQQFVDQVLRTLASTGLAAQALSFELTESLPLLASTWARPHLQDLARRGIGLALDDFGTGFGSLLDLRDLPVSGVKIDKQFVAGLPNAVDLAVVRAIRDLAAARGAWCVAEGIETEAQRQHLLNLGIRHGQGFWLARPMDAGHLQTYLTITPAGAELTRSA